MAKFSKKSKEASNKKGLFDFQLEKTIDRSMYKECPNCKRTSFYHVNTVLDRFSSQSVSAQLLINLTEYVGEKTGFCRHCGVICHGDIFCSGYSEAKLMKISFELNTIFNTWNKISANIMNEKNVTEDNVEEVLGPEYEKFLKEAVNLKPDIYTRSNIDKFINHCFNHFIKVENR